MGHKDFAKVLVPLSDIVVSTVISIKDPYNTEIVEVDVDEIRRAMVDMITDGVHPLDIITRLIRELTH